MTDSNLKLFQQKHGLAHNEITELFSHDNFMYVGTSNGISLIDINTFHVFSPEIPFKNELFRVQDFLLVEAK